MQDAIAFTWQTLTARLRNLRIGSFTCLILAVLIGMAVILRPSWWALAGLPVFLLCGFFFLYRDQSLVFTWEAYILDQWSQPDFVMGIFIQAFANNPHALKNSLKSMVSALPADPDYRKPAPEQIRLAKRLFLTRKAAQEIRLFRSVARNAALAALPVLCLDAYRAEGLLRLYFLGPVLLYPAMQDLIGRLITEGWRKRLANLEPMGPEEKINFIAQMKSLDWNKVPKRWARRFEAYASGAIAG